MKTLLLMTAFLMIALANGKAQITTQNPGFENKIEADVQLTPNNVIVVRYLNVDNRKIKVLIYNQDGEKIDSRAYRTGGDMKLTYKLKNMPKGELVFKVLSNDSLVYAERIKISENGKFGIPVPVTNFKMLEISNTSLMVDEQ